MGFLVDYRKGMPHNDNKNSDMSTIKKIPVYRLGPYLDKAHTPYTENYYANP